jgi:soluble lytic murein transglycosylase-like protein
MTFIRATVLALALAGVAQPAYSMTRAELEALAAAHAAANGVPVALVHRVIIRESRYNPRLIGKGGAMGLMQIKAATARGVGYNGSAAGLLDPTTNLTYAVRYLAGAYRLAGGNHDRAVSYYARGYYYAAKSKGQTIQTLATSGGQSFALSASADGVMRPVAVTAASVQRAFAAPVLDPKRDRDP